MSAQQQWVLASNNAGKLREFNALFEPLGIAVCPQSQWAVPDCEEPFFTFVENALAKARHASQHTGLPALADDSGLMVYALGDAPGVFSARYATLFGQPKSDTNNNACLIQNLQGHADRRAAYIAVLVFVRHANDPAPIIAQALWSGQIVDTPQGQGGFGYDPHFYLPALQKTAAQLTAEEKNRCSHRGQALQKLMTQLHTYGLI